METTQPTMIGHFLTEDDKRSIEELLDKSKGPMMTLPTSSTIVNVFPGDLRDWFAGQAMSGILSGSESEYGGYSTCDLLAKVSYQTADAMLKARATTTEGETKGRMK